MNLKQVGHKAHRVDDTVVSRIEDLSAEHRRKFLEVLELAMERAEELGEGNYAKLELVNNPPYVGVLISQPPGQVLLEEYVNVTQEIQQKFDVLAVSHGMFSDNRRGVSLSLDLENFPLQG